jgi:hypothetical protein
MSFARIAFAVFIATGFATQSAHAEHPVRADALRDLDRLVNAHARFPLLVKAAKGTPLFRSFVEAAAGLDHLTGKAGPHNGAAIDALQRKRAELQLDEAEASIVLAHGRLKNAPASTELEHLVMEHSGHPHAVLAAIGTPQFTEFVKSVLELQKTLGPRGHGHNDLALTALQRIRARQNLTRAEHAILFGLP